jgi:hypothetical protein
MQQFMNARSLTPSPSPEGRGEFRDAIMIAFNFGVR